MRQMRSVTYEVYVQDMAAARSLLEEVPGFTADYGTRSANRGRGLIVAVKLYDNSDAAAFAFDEDLNYAEQILRAVGIPFRRRAVEVAFQWDQETEQTP